MCVLVFARVHAHACSRGRQVVWIHFTLSRWDCFPALENSVLQKDTGGDQRDLTGDLVTPRKPTVNGVASGPACTSGAVVPSSPAQVGPRTMG